MNEKERLIEKLIGTFAQVFDIIPHPFQVQAWERMSLNRLKIALKQMKEIEK